MKTNFYKAYTIAAALMLCSPGIQAASVYERFKTFIGSEFTNLQGLYIMAGIVMASLITYFIINHFSHEDERAYPPHYSHSRRHHHHHHRIIRKTS